MVSHPLLTLGGPIPQSPPGIDAHGGRPNFLPRHLGRLCSVFILYEAC